LAIRILRERGQQGPADTASRFSRAEVEQIDVRLFRVHRVHCSLHLLRLEDATTEEKDVVGGGNEVGGQREAGTPWWEGHGCARHLVSITGNERLTQPESPTRHVEGIHPAHRPWSPSLVREEHPHRPVVGECRR
jgi:hypothetical protein